MGSAFGPPLRDFWHSLIHYVGIIICRLIKKQVSSIILEYIYGATSTLGLKLLKKLELSRRFFYILLILQYKAYMAIGTLRMRMFSTVMLPNFKNCALIAANTK